MKQGIWSAVLLVAVFVLPLVVCASGTGPETMNLKERFKVEGRKNAVIFPHWKHQAKLECTRCHATAEGGRLKLEIVKKTTMGNDFHRKFCWPCHVEMKVPKGKSCTTCHKK